MKRLLLILFFAFSQKAWGIVYVSSGAVIGVEYDEPNFSVTSTGSTTTLKDLQKTTVFYDIGQGSVTARSVNATKLAGGGHIDTNFFAPISINQEKNISVWATATSTRSLESVKSNTDMMLLDRLAPGTGSTGGLVTGTRIEVSYIEPTRKANGTILNDLFKTVIFYDKGQGSIAIKEVLSSNPQGGGTIKEIVIIPVGDNQENTVRIWWIAYDISGNPSAPSLASIKNLDTAEPSPPQ